jgi:protein-S-isoprenylcysteine O-methyltransferase Ste14
MPIPASSVAVARSITLVAGTPGEPTMRATALEFRLRMAINAAIIVLGIWAPWIPQDNRVRVMEWLPLELARTGLVAFSASVSLVLAIAGLLAALGAILRVWGAAYLGPAVVTHFDMQAASVTISGPYRYVRNPLYIGLWCMVAALALLMPPSGAALSLLLLAFFLVRLTLGEESFLSAQLGEPYRAYLGAVPRYLPRLRSTLPSTHVRPQWLRAVVSELTPISVLVAVVVLAWNYDAHLMARIILIGLGLSLISRAFLPRAESTLSAQPLDAGAPSRQGASSQTPRDT